MLALPRAALLAGPVALAFFAGGYGDRPRLVALAVAGVALAWAAAVSPARGSILPGGTGPRLAVGGLIALATWVALSRSWAPLDDIAADDTERLVLYAAALTTGALAWRSRPAARLVEPATALGILLVTAYGLSGRLLPGIVEQTASATAGGRFEQPLTYWNASGLHAALGLVLFARIAGDRERPGWMRSAAVAAAVPLAAGTYLSFSRGALAALAAGLVVLLVLAPTRPQLRALAITLEAAGLGLLGVLLSPAVRTLQGSDGARELQGALVLLGMVLAAAGGVALMRWALRDERDGRLTVGGLGLPRWAGKAALGAVVALVLVPVLVAGRNDTASADPAFGATSARLATADSRRYDYWRVAVDAWVAEPVTGTGTGGYAVAWLRERPQPERIRDAHSLPLETLAELGLVGLALLLSAAAGIVICARRVQTGDPVLAAGPIAALTAFALHATLDWDWEIPAVTLLALGLAGMLVARAGPASAQGRRGAGVEGGQALGGGQHTADVPLR